MLFCLVLGIAYSHSYILLFLNVVLKGLKQETSKGWKACELCEGKVIMSNPIFIICLMAFNVTCDP